MAWRKVINSLAGISAVLFLLSIGLRWVPGGAWPRTHPTKASSYMFVAKDRGAIELYSVLHLSKPDVSPDIWDDAAYHQWRERVHEMGPLIWGKHGTPITDGKIYPDGKFRMACFDYYRSEQIQIFWLNCLFAVGPAGWGVWYWKKRKKRWREGLCRGCLYDLAGNESGVCPECGRRVD